MLEPISLSVPEVIDAERYPAAVAQAEPPPVPPEMQGVKTETARVPGDQAQSLTAERKPVPRRIAEAERNERRRSVVANKDDHNSGN